MTLETNKNGDGNIMKKNQKSNGQKMEGMENMSDHRTCKCGKDCKGKQGLTFAVSETSNNAHLWSLFDDLYECEEQLRLIEIMGKDYAGVVIIHMKDGNQPPIALLNVDDWDIICLIAQSALPEESRIKVPTRDGMSVVIPKQKILYITLPYAKNGLKALGCQAYGNGIDLMRNHPSEDTIVYPYFEERRYDDKAKEEVIRTSIGTEHRPMTVKWYNDKRRLMHRQDNGRGLKLNHGFDVNFQP
jgi:hypothetical protein